MVLRAQFGQRPEHEVADRPAVALTAVLAAAQHLVPGRLPAACGDVRGREIGWERNGTGPRMVSDEMVKEPSQASRSCGRLEIATSVAASSRWRTCGFMQAKHQVVGPQARNVHAACPNPTSGSSKSLVRNTASSWLAAGPAAASPPRSSCAIAASYKGFPVVARELLVREAEERPGDLHQPAVLDRVLQRVPDARPAGAPFRAARGPPLRSSRLGMPAEWASSVK